MPDLKTFFTALAPGRAIVNARRELVEQEQLHAELDALAHRIMPVGSESLPEGRLAS
jgi:hypothetical protein